MKQLLFFFSLLFFVISFNGQKLDKTNQDKFDNYLNLGNNYLNNRKLDSAKIYLKKADSLLVFLKKDSSNFYKKEILNASLLTRENKPDISVEKLLKTLTYFRTKKDSTNIGICLYKLSIANYYLNRRKITKKYSQEALLYKTHLSKKLVTKLYQNLGTVNLEDGMKKNDSLVYSAIKSYEKAIEIYKEENWISDQALATSLLAECYNQLDKFNIALNKIDEAILLSKKDKNKSQEGFALIKKASILGNKNNYVEALKTIRNAKPIFLEINDNPTYLYALNEEKKILIGLKRHKEATIIGDEIFNVSVGNYNIRFADKVAEMDAKYKTAENEAEIATQKEKLLEKELAIKNKNLYAIIITSILVILTIIFIGLYKKNQYKRKQLRKEIDLKDSLAIIKTQNRLQEQRLRISRDLHDNIGAQLSFIISSLDNLKFISKDVNETLQHKIVNISSFTSETIHEFRDTIWAMNKNKITVEDLHFRILSFIEKAKKATNGIEFVINQNITKEISMSSLKGMHVFRVIQEAINNALKYANASKISIDISKNENEIQITITDNGKGFNVKTVEIGNGLSNMETRMSEINGKVIINSDEKGTQIKIIA